MHTRVVSTTAGEAPYVLDGIQTKQKPGRQLRNRYTNVWARSDGGWRMIAWQSTAVPS